MKSKHHYSGRAVSVPVGIGIGAALSLIVSILSAAVLAWLVLAERIGEDGIGWGCMVILPLATAIGSAAAQSLVKHQKMMVCAVHCAAYYLVLLVLALPLGGAYDAMIVTAALIGLGGGITLIPSLIGNKSGGRSYKISGFR